MLYNNTKTGMFTNCFYFAVTLKHVAKTVAHVHLSDHVVNVVFTLFDENSKLDFASGFL